MRRRFLLPSALLLFLTAVPARSWDPRLGPDSFLLGGEGYCQVIGAHRSHTTREDETLIELARVARVGYEALQQANPGIDSWLPAAGQAVLLPYSTILPAGSAPGITVNLAELRLYFLWKASDGYRVRTYPVGIGIDGWETPEGGFVVHDKIEKPTWRVPPSIRKEQPELPATVSPGPDNPLGEFWLGLGPSGYGIHGTSQPFGVGRRVSHGCLRLYPEDIRDLFARVEIGTPVRIIYQPIKVGLRGGRLFVEIHPDVLGRVPNPVAEVKRLVSQRQWSGEIDEAVLEREIELARGIPVVISGD